MMILRGVQHFLAAHKTQIIYINTFQISESHSIRNSIINYTA